jgi:hypothetical protein
VGRKETGGGIERNGSGGSLGEGMRDRVEKMIPDLTKRKGGESEQRKKVKNIKCYVFQE